MNRIGKAFLLIFAFLALASPAFCDKVDQEHNLVLSAIAKQANGDLDGAIADFTGALALNPKNANAYTGRASAEYAKKDFDNAIADSTRALEINPFIAKAYYIRGAAEQAKPGVEASIADATKAIEFNSLYADAYQLRGIAKKIKGDLDGAIADFSKAIEISPDLAEAYANRGAAKAAKGDLDGGRADSNKALQLKPSLAEAQSNRDALTPIPEPPPPAEPPPPTTSNSPAHLTQTAPHTLHELLQLLEDNLLNYHANVPSFFCDEHVISSEVSSHNHKTTTTDSLFRLRRVPNPDHTTTLTESRDIKTVDDHRPVDEDLTGPTIVHGAFSGGISLVSLSQQACMDYKLQSIKPTQPYVIEFTSVPAAHRPQKCLLQEDGSGRVIIDPASFEIRHIELRAPHHTILPAGKAPNGYNIPAIIGVWDLSIDYAAVQLDGRTFWLPSTINSTGTAGFIANKTFWTFKASYSNYHKLQITTRILPGMRYAPTDPHK